MSAISSLARMDLRLICSVIVSAILATTSTRADDNATSSAPSSALAPVNVDGRAQPLDLKLYYHSPASRFDKDKNYPWRDVPKGSHTFCGIPLEIEGRICLWGRTNANRGLVFPEKLGGIKVDRKFDSLYLYHATFHNALDGTPFVTVVFQYDDGSTVETDLCYGTNVRDWYQSPSGPEELTDPKSKLAWSGVNSLSPANAPRNLQFFLTEIANPISDVKVKSIDLVSLKEGPASCIMAMTTGQAGLLTDAQDPKHEPVDPPLEDSPIVKPK